MGCVWETSDPEYRAYHDAEWGVPVHDDRLLFEMLNLEGAQAGLSWLVILRKRERYREVFSNFDIERVARIRPARIDRIVLDPGVVRHRGKLDAVVGNARAAKRVIRDFGSLDEYLWQFVGGSPRVNRYRRPRDVPADTPDSAVMSRDLKRRGFRFVGPTICYAFMQAVGMVNDHLVSCPRYRALGGARGTTRLRSGSR